MAEIRINTTGGLKLYDADDSHYAQIIAGTITSNVDLLTLNSAGITVLDGAIDFDIASHDTSNGLKLGGTLVTATAAELNIMDGVTATAAEINLIDGGTSRGTTALADGDGILINDAGTMRMTNVTAVKTYMSSATAADDVSTGDAAVNLQTSSGDVLLDSQAGATTVDGHTGVTVQSTNSGNVTLDSVADVVLDADGDQISFKFGGATGQLDIGNANSGDITFSQETDAKDMVFLQYDNSEVFRILDNQELSTHGETAPDTDPGGICLHQGVGVYQGHISLKGAGVSHDITGGTYGEEADTMAKFEQNNNNEGGLEILALTEGEVAIELRAIANTPDTTTTANGNGGFEVTVHVESSNDTAAYSADQNMITFANNDLTTHIFKGDGDIYYDGADQGAFDELEDAQLVRTLDLSKNINVVNSTFDKYVKYNHEKLAELKLVGRETDGTPNHFINITGLQRLHNGAIWQQYTKHNQLLEAVYDLAKEAVGENKADAILEKHNIKLLN